MPYFSQPGLRLPLPGGASLSPTMDLYHDRLDDLIGLSLRPRSRPKGWPRNRSISAVKLPGLWQGQELAPERYWQRETVLGASGELRQYLGDASKRLALRVLLLSDPTVTNVLSGALNQAAGAMGLGRVTEALGLGDVGSTRTCYDELRDLWAVLNARDEQGAPMVWEIDAEFASILGLLTCTFESPRILDPQGETIEATVTMEEWFDFDLPTIPTEAP